MNIPVNKSLVPVPRNLPARVAAQNARKKEKAAEQAARDYDLVRNETYLNDASEVEKYLPDILGRALARIWIDDQFRQRFAHSPVETLAAYGVYLPRTISIDFVTEGTPRPQIVVYETKRMGLQRRRLMSLRLMMMAGQ
ncbi:hypothetical protein HCZ30_00480 [Marivivens donghaensis]|uniref:Uncharacterized protein n=1 Tax=Marivivens donghaensis TaxID=1699413 RepID=A0ABX0VT44_9RHOB|nr:MULTISPECIES: hypothetical protein [Marivivens]NIY70905.1 hypothetical protein [Marivivens donghaensis]